MSYGYNLSKISLEDFVHILKKSYLIPSMRVLLEDMDEKFVALKEHGLISVADLYLQTKTKKKAESLAEQTNIDQDYMVILRRMVSSYIAKPRKLEEYPDLDDWLVRELALAGIKTSIHLHDYLFSHTDEQTQKDYNLESSHLTVLRTLLEVGQLRYVSPLFATVLVRSGYDSIEKIANTDAAVLHQAIISTNREQEIYKGNIGDSDAQFLIDDAKVYLKYMN